MAMPVSGPEPFSTHGWHLHKRCHGKGPWGCSVGLRSNILHGEGVRREDVTTDGCREMPSELQRLIRRADRCLQEWRLPLRNLFTFPCLFHTKPSSVTSPASPPRHPYRDHLLPPRTSTGHRRVAEGTRPRGCSPCLPLFQQDSWAGV